MTVSISPALEDYLESILILQKKGKIARVKDIAAFINVKAPSVIGALSSLKEKGLISHEPYGYIALTRKGTRKAKSLYTRHIALKTFFHRVLGVEPSLAEKDACRIEHYLSEETIARMVGFIKILEKKLPSEPPLSSLLESVLNDAEKGSSRAGQAGRAKKGIPE